MNKELTAMQMLIESIDARLAQESDKSAIHNLEICLMVSKSLLQKEQEQIEQAFTYGCFFHDENKQQSANEYYLSKYLGEK